MARSKNRWKKNRSMTPEQRADLKTAMCSSDVPDIKKTADQSGANKLTRLKPSQGWRGEITLEKHEELNKRSFKASLCMNMNRASSGSRKVTKYRKNHLSRNKKVETLRRPSVDWLTVGA
jgi:hypothetical protein